MSGRGLRSHDLALPATPRGESEPSLAAAYAVAAAVTRRQARNFSYGIRLLARPERQAMCALYAFARRVDDVGDGDLPLEDKRRELALLREAVRGLAPGRPGRAGSPRSCSAAGAGDTPERGPDPVLLALADSAARYPIPLSALEELIDGVEADVEGRRYETIEELVGYCRLVAGSIGRLTLSVLGCRDPSRGPRLAEALGVALQLTNILRDVVEDRAMGRVYLPGRDLESVGVGPDLSGPTGALETVVADLARHAAAWFAEGWQLLELLEGRGRACVGAMAGIYAGILVRILRRPGAVLERRVALSAREKALVAARCLVGRPGLPAALSAAGGRSGGEAR